MIELWLPPKPAIIRPASDELRRDWRRAKQANLLPGWFPGAAFAPSGPDFSHIASTSDDSNQTTYTFASQSFGAVASDRRIIVSIRASGTSTNNNSISTVTIGGVSATIHAQANNNGNTRNGHAGVASAAVPTGTSGSIVIVYATDLGLLLGCHISVYRATGLVSGTPFDTATSTDASTLLIDIPANGILISCAATVSGSGHTWPSPLVEDADAASDGVQLSSAHTPVQGAASTNFSAGPSAGGGSGTSRYAAASWA